MKKFFYSAVVALALFGAGARAAQAQARGVRVGPTADDAAAEATPAPKKDEKKAAPAGDAKSGRQVEPAVREPAGVREAPGAEKSRAPDKNGAKADAKPQVPAPLPNDTTVAATPPVAGATSATTDAPVKPGTDRGLPVGSPVKTAAGAEGADESNKAARPAPAANSPKSPNGPAAGTNSPAATPNTSAPARNTPAALNTSVTTPNNSAASPNVSASSARPAAAAASPANIYRVGVGDVLDIRLLNGQDPRQSTLYPVVAGGVLDYPLLRDPLTVAGMTTDELAAQLIAELRHRGVYERPQVRVSVREYASHAVLVSGLVGDPGTKILRREAIPLYVVIAEAQPRPEAGRAVIISHSTGKIINVDLNDAAALNTLVHSGDVVTLTVRPPEFYYVGGEIGAPGQKDFHAGLTLTQALLASGGVTRAAGERVRVSRQGADGRLVSAEYNLREIEAGGVPDPLLQPGDRVEVQPRRK